MNTEYVVSLLQTLDFKCPVCGQKRYITDHGNHEWTVHCASAEARFWDFGRGTLAQTIAKQHWDQSKLEIYFTGAGVS